MKVRVSPKIVFLFITLVSIPALFCRVNTSLAPNNALIQKIDPESKNSPETNPMIPNDVYNDPPIISVSPINESVHPGGTEINVSLTDPDLDSVKIRWDGGPLSLYNSHFISTNLPLSNGLHTLNVWANNSIAETSKNYTFLTDNDPPTFVFPSHEEEAFISVRSGEGHEIVVSNVSDADPIDILSSSWDYEIWVEWDVVIKETTPTGDGLHTLYVFLNTSRGYNTTRCYNFIVDDTEPTVDILDPEPGEPLVGPPTFNVMVVEANIDAMWYTLNGSNPVFVNETTGVIDAELWSGLTEGDATLKFYVNDTVGHESYDTVVFQKESQKLKMPGFSPAIIVGFIGLGVLIKLIIFKKENSR